MTQARRPKLWEYVSNIQQLSRDPKGTRKLHAMHAGIGEDRFEHSIVYDPGLNRYYLEMWYVDENMLNNPYEKEQEGPLAFKAGFPTEAEAKLAADNVRTKLTMTILNKRTEDR